MTQQKLIASIEQYQPYNVQEEMDKSHSGVDKK